MFYVSFHCFAFAITFPLREWITKILLHHRPVFSKGRQSPHWFSLYISPWKPIWSRFWLWFSFKALEEIQSKVDLAKWGLSGMLSSMFSLKPLMFQGMCSAEDVLVECAKGDWMWKGQEKNSGWQMTHHLGPYGCGEASCTRWVENE